MSDIRSSQPNQNVADLSGCGKCLDLVGKSQTQWVDLKACDTNDDIAAFFWRNVNLNDYGAIELFSDSNFTGNRTTLFLSEWESGKLYSISSWWLADRVSAVRWKSLWDRQTAALFNNADGTGSQFNNIFGYGGTKEVANLKDVGFNDAVSSFRWDAVVPVMESVDPISIMAPSQGLVSRITL